MDSGRLNISHDVSNTAEGLRLQSDKYIVVMWDFNEIHSVRRKYCFIHKYKWTQKLVFNWKKYYYCLSGEEIPYYYYYYILQSAHHLFFIVPSQQQ